MYTTPRHPTKGETFRILKEMALPIESIVDVGILTCTADLMQSFRHLPHYLVEPIEEFYPRIEEIYSKDGIDYELIKVAASSSDGTARLKTATVRDGVQITHSRLTDEKGEGDNFRDVPTMTIDTLVKKYNVPGPFLLKIDVDGAELEVLKGAVDVLSDCSVLCIEAGIKTFADRCNAALSLGFELFDITDLCYYDSRFAQADFVFVNSKIMKDLRLDMYIRGFDVKKWVPYTPVKQIQKRRKFLGMF